VFHERLVVDDGAYSFLPEVEVTNKYTIDNEHAIHQNAKIVRNDMNTTSFFIIDSDYPFYALAPSTTEPDLLFKMSFSQAAIGQKHILQYVADTADLTPLSSQIAAN
jgi:hypothetical protein